MKLGLLADIHENNRFLREALNKFRQNEVDRVVVLGDLFRDGQGIEETCELLSEAEAVGAWGNHDFGLSREPDPIVINRFSEGVLGFMAKLQPMLEIGGCLFSHIEPWLDPEDIADLWMDHGLPEHQDRVSRIFGATTNRVIFGGHHHCWIMLTPELKKSWRGERPAILSEGRYFVTIAAVCDGAFAIYDTEECLLTPYS